MDKLIATFSSSHRKYFSKFNQVALQVKVKVKSLSCVQLLATPWTVAHQAPVSMGFSRQECWRGRDIAFSSDVGNLISVPLPFLNPA